MPAPTSHATGDVSDLTAAAARRERSPPATNAAAQKATFVMSAEKPCVAGHPGATTHRKIAPNRSDAKSVLSAASAKTSAHQDGGRSLSQCGRAVSPLPMG